MRIDGKPSTRVVFWILCGIFMALAAASFLLQMSPPFPHRKLLVQLTHVAVEANVWTWANVAVLVTAANSYLVAARERWLEGDRRSAASWLVLAAMMAALSLDDLVSLHEKLHFLGVLMGGGGKGFLRFAWILPGALLAFTFAVIAITISRRFDPAPKTYLALGLVVFFTGALGAEAVSGKIIWGGYPLLTRLVVHVEEVLEAVGAALFLSAGIAALECSRFTGHAGYRA